MKANAKSHAVETVKVTISNVPPKLAKLLAAFTHIDSHETRCHSSKGDKLYVHFSRPKPTMSVER